MIRAVLFDLGNTLFYEESPEKITIDILPELGKLPNYLTVYRSLGLRFDNVCEASLDAIAYYYASKSGEGRISINKAREIKEKLIESLADHLKPIKGTKEIIKKIKEKGAKVAIISNASSQEAVERALERSGIINMFDAVVTSRLIGVRKPDPRIFLYTLNLIEIKPSEAVFIGDREYEDICGAKTVGMKAIHLIRDEVKPSSCADDHIRSIQEVLKVLDL